MKSLDVPPSESHDHAHERGQHGFAQRVLVSKDFWATVAAIGATIIGILLVAVLQKAVNIHDSATTVALLLVPLLVYGIVSGRLRELRGPGGWGAKFARLEKDQRQLSNELEVLKLLVAGYMTTWELDHLAKLQNNKEFTCDVRDWTTEKFFRYQIANLLGRGFIDYIEGSGDLFGPGEPPVRDVRRYFRITHRGQEYLRLHESMFARPQN